MGELYIILLPELWAVLSLRCLALSTEERHIEPCYGVIGDGSRNRRRELEHEARPALGLELPGVRALTVTPFSVLSGPLTIVTLVESSSRLRARWLDKLLMEFELPFPGNCKHHPERILIFFFFALTPFQIHIFLSERQNTPLGKGTWVLFICPVLTDLPSSSWSFTFSLTFIYSFIYGIWITPSVSRDHSWWSSRYHIWCWDRTQVSSKQGKWVSQVSIHHFWCSKWWWIFPLHSDKAHIKLTNLRPEW